MENKVELEYTIHLKYRQIVDTSTGEILSIELIDKKVDSTTKAPKTQKAKTNESSDATLTLDTNKYCLNQAAMQLMNIETGNRLEIRYEQQGNQSIPIIATELTFKSKNGNVITKANSVAFRGNKHDELAKHGDVFKIEPHPSMTDVFVLKGNNVVTVDYTEEKIDEVTSPDDIDFSDLIDESEVTEVTSSMFKF